MKSGPLLRHGGLPHRNKDCQENLHSGGITPPITSTSVQDKSEVNIERFYDADSADFSGVYQ
jgi:hypothetical protein